MLRKLLSFILTFAIVNSIFALSKQTEKDFIKGSISDKINILKSIKEDNSLFLPQKTFDFTIQNQEIASNDPQFLELCLEASRLIPEEKEKIELMNLELKSSVFANLISIFQIFNNKSFRELLMDKINLYALPDSKSSIDFFNTYLSDSFTSKEKSENVIEKVIVTLGKNGNSESLSIIYNIWSSKIWPEYQDSLDQALLSLTHDSVSEALKIFSLSSLEDSFHYFNLLCNSEEISKESLCNIAENALLFSINNMEKLKSSNESQLVKLQLSLHSLLCMNKWSHASSVINSSILLLAEDYKAGLIGEESFSEIILLSAGIPSHKLAEIFNQMLTDCNDLLDSSTKDSKRPARSVVLALITCLGELGDKIAFDTLLYVTYLPYSSEVIDEAKKSLSSLNW